MSLAVYLNDYREHFDSFEKTAKDILPDVDLTTKKQRFVEEEEKNKIMTVMQLMLQRI